MDLAQISCFSKLEITCYVMRSSKSEYLIKIPKVQAMPMGSTRFLIESRELLRLQILYLSSANKYCEAGVEPDESISEYVFPGAVLYLPGCN
jgi:hypothetical protein